MHVVINLQIMAKIDIFTLCIHDRQAGDNSWEYYTKNPPEKETGDQNTNGENPKREAKLLEDSKAFASRK